MLKRRRYGLRKGSVSYLGTLEHCRCCWQGCLLLWTMTRKRVDSDKKARVSDLNTRVQYTLTPLRARRRGDEYMSEVSGHIAILQVYCYCQLLRQFAAHARGHTMVIPRRYAPRSTYIYIRTLCLALPAYTSVANDMGVQIVRFHWRPCSYAGRGNPCTSTSSFQAVLLTRGS